MVAVVEKYTTEEQRCVVLFCGQKDQCNGYSFPIYGVKSLPRKAVHNWIHKFSQWRSKVADDAQPVAEVSETTARRHLC
jgi:hypothetical protein